MAVPRASAGKIFTMTTCINGIEIPTAIAAMIRPARNIHHISCWAGVSDVIVIPMNSSKYAVMYNTFVGMRVDKNADTGIIMPFANINQVVACCAVANVISKSRISVGMAVPSDVCIKAPANVPINSTATIALRLNGLPLMSVKCFLTIVTPSITLFTLSYGANLNIVGMKPCLSCKKH